MMTPSVFRDLNSWIECGARVLLVGDSFQLPPVVTGKELQQYGEDYSVFAQVQGALLQTVMRSVGGVLRAATKVRETGEICAQSDLDASGEGYEYVRTKLPIEQAIEEYLADPSDHMLISWRNVVRMNANKQVRARLGRDGPLPDDGEPVLIKKNGQGHLNGEIIPCGGFEAGPIVGSLRTLWMRVGAYKRLLVTVDGGDREKGGEMFDGQQPWIEDWKKYHIDLQQKCLPEPLPLTWGYVATAHSAQGSESRRVTVFLERGDERSSHFRKMTTLPDGSKTSFASRFVYTATTRAKVYTKMIVGR
jgi:hypothetical protein